VKKWGKSDAILQVIGKRVAKTGNNVSYVVNDGIFGAFGRLLTDDDVVLEPKLLNRCQRYKTFFVRNLGIFVKS
jgi:hypothetical protein